MSDIWATTRSSAPTAFPSLKLQVREDPLRVGVTKNTWLPLPLSSQSRNTVPHWEGQACQLLSPPIHLKSHVAEVWFQVRGAENSGAAFLHSASTHKWAFLPQVQQPESTKARLSSSQLADGEKVLHLYRQAEENRLLLPQPSTVLSHEASLQEKQATLLPPALEQWPRGFA